jgi:hypothetical protein
VRWVALWVVLVLWATVILGILVRSVFGKAVALMREMSTAAERLGAVSEALEAETGEAAQRRLAVFIDPAEARRERAKLAKAAARGSDARHRLSARSRRTPSQHRERTT